MKNLNEFTLQVVPENFKLTVSDNQNIELLGAAEQNYSVANFKEVGNMFMWDYPDEQLHIDVQKKADYISVKLTSTAVKTTRFNWPHIVGDTYVLPIGEGKIFSSDDPAIKAYYSNPDYAELAMVESFSMPFFAFFGDHHGVVYTQKDNYNDTLKFTAENNIQATLMHEFAKANDDKCEAFRIYLTDPTPTAVANVYRQYREEQVPIKTLLEKINTLPSTQKLIGAGHYYLWNSRLLEMGNVNWTALQVNTDQLVFHKVSTLLDIYGEDGSTDFKAALAKLAQGKAFNYEKNIILEGLNLAIKLPAFYDTTTFPHPDNVANEYLEKGINNLVLVELYDLNKHLLFGAIKQATQDISEWGRDNSIKIINEMINFGIHNAWIGLPDWVYGLWQPTMLSAATKANYLIGPYDSYQTIHQIPSVNWDTASFSNSNLWEQATVERENGQKVPGFLGQGRKLNPTIIQEEVAKRYQAVSNSGKLFNSWFVDVDAAGEIYNDYTPVHITPKYKDVEARNQRLQFFQTNQKVVGSEQGNDYASDSISFAHGIETPVIAWGDPEMYQDKNSQYYVGAYGSPDGTVPTRYSKAVPLKSVYRPLYVDPRYSVPLYQLVYHNAVITNHHWEWDSYKIKSEVGTRRLTEYLYQTPFLCHLDAALWEKNKTDIIQNAKTWEIVQKSFFSLQMTDFTYLSADKLVQQTQFGPDHTVAVNYSTTVFDDYPPRTATIKMAGEVLAVNVATCD